MIRKLLVPSRCCVSQIIARSFSKIDNASKKSRASEELEFLDDMMGSCWDSPEEPVSFDSSLKKWELTLICNEIDSAGNLRTNPSKYRKSQLCVMHELQPRDLRKLDGTLKNQLPGILVRSSAILVNLDIIKAIIKSDRFILFESLDLAERIKQNAFLKELQRHVKINLKSTKTLSFEFQVLEFILIKTCAVFQQELEQLLPNIETASNDFGQYVHWDKLKGILECKKKINHFKSRIANIRDAISEVLNSDADMAAMYLSNKDLSNPRPVSAHEEIELLLETYLKIADEMVTRVEELSLNIESTEDIINIGLIGQRNELLLLELKLTIGTFAASMGGFGASLFGMNLTSHLEATSAGFYIASGSLITIALASFLGAWKRMRNLVQNKKLFS